MIDMGYLREAVLEDVERLEELEEQLFPDNCFGARLLETELSYGHGLVYEVSGSIVAYALARVEGELVDITRLGVVSGHRKRGLATQLLTEAMKLAPKAMLMVRRENEVALHLYYRFGFHICGVTIGGSWVMLHGFGSGRRPTL